jgi:putative component of toxin-antitoxin plasmid stabilization module
VAYELLCGGTKRQQQRDIQKAWELARLLKEE